MSDSLVAVDGPGLSTKEKAQQYIGLDMKSLKQKKDEFKTKIIPEWLKQAQEKQRI